MPRPEKVRLGEILLQQGLLTEQQLQDALAEQKRSGRKLGRVFVEKGFVSEEQISTALAKQLQVPYVNLKHFTVKPEVAMRLPETQARRFRALVLEDAGAFYRVAMADPTDLFAYDEVSRSLKREIQLAVVTEIAAAADHRPRLPPHRGDLRPGRGAGPGAGRRRASTSPRWGSPPRSRTRRSCACCRRVFEDAVGVRASDIHIEPQETQADHPLPHRRGAARADRGRPQDRLGAGAAPEAHVRAGHLREAPAAGRPLQRQGAQRPDRRAHLDHADAVRRVGGDASAQSEQRPAHAGPPRHAVRASWRACAT